MTDLYGEVPHRLLHQCVRDIASGAVGELMAVVVEDVGRTGPYWVELAYIRIPSGVEITTAVANIEAAG
ncbi:hypothetical protein [Streptomyces xanthophaeus]